MSKIKVSITLDKDVVEWVDEIAENLDMARSEFINMVLSGGRDAKEIIDKMLDRWFDRKKAEAREKLKAVAR